MSWKPQQFSSPFSSSSSFFFVFTGWFFDWTNRKMNDTTMQTTTTTTTTISTTNGDPMSTYWNKKSIPHNNLCLSIYSSCSELSKIDTRVRCYYSHQKIRHHHNIYNSGMYTILYYTILSSSSSSSPRENTNSLLYNIHVSHASFVCSCLLMVDSLLLQK